MNQIQLQRTYIHPKVRPHNREPFFCLEAVLFVKAKITFEDEDHVAVVPCRASPRPAQVFSPSKAFTIGKSQHEPLLHRLERHHHRMHGRIHAIHTKATDAIVERLDGSISDCGGGRLGGCVMAWLHGWVVGWMGTWVMDTWVTWWWGGCVHGCLNGWVAPNHLTTNPFISPLT